MPKVDAVFVGCEAVLANGGIINKIGTYSVALIAQHFQKQVYVFCESFKFTELFPLSQDDVYEMLEETTGNSRHKVDYTPPENIALFFTDMGIFTASGISDELTQFFNN
jgi:translation initiation factor eIF-2B subunit alpha